MRKESSTNSLNEKKLREVCATVYTLSIIGGRWKPTILHILLHGKQRFSQLRDILPNISERMLSQQLKELEKDGIITRIVHAEVPPRVEYELTADGLSMQQMLRSISEWGVTHKRKHATPEEKETAVFECTYPS
jgi:DNA-binding HxlR family transcriptional regulator